MAEDICLISSQDLLEPHFSTVLACDLTHTHYWSLDWSPEWYVALARRGFIATAYVHEGHDLLLPELQEAYAVLDWPARRMAPAVRRLCQRSDFLQAGYSLELSSAPAAIQLVMNGIEAAFPDQSWLSTNYRQLMLSLASWRRGFRLIATLLRHGDGSVMAGELGYLIGAVYTSLSGFLNRADPRHNHLGKVQLCALAGVLEKSGMDFWNLGHPYMQYKLDLGALIVPRAAFLNRWERAVGDGGAASGVAGAGSDARAVSDVGLNGLSGLNGLVGTWPVAELMQGA